MNRTIILASFLLALALSALHADDQLLQTQHTLKDQGFFYGEPDGKSGAETTAAIKRFQIRNGLEVTGALNPETVAALHSGGSDNAGAAPASPSPKEESGTVPPPAAPQSDGDFLRQNPPPASKRVVVPPPAPIQPGPGSDAGSIFAGTPYESAPGVVRQDTVRRAQIRLTRDGFYRGEIDGMPGPGTSHAIKLYQEAGDLPETGRLDMETLARMDLLPQRRAIAPPDPYFVPPNPYFVPPPRRRFIHEIIIP